MSETMPVMRPILPPLTKVNPYLEAVYESGIFSNRGPLVRRLEERYAEWFGVEPELVVAVSNGTVSLSAAAVASGGQKFLVPEWTFPATAMGPVQVGKTIEFRDVNPETWLLQLTENDYADAANVVPMPVAPYGMKFDFEPWKNFPHLILDAAASVGTRQSLSGILPDWSVTVSLHATKVLGCGEGGLVIFGDKAKAQLVREWINFGFSGARVTERIGTNGKMSELTAAFALAALDSWDEEKADWLAAKALVDRVNKRLGLSTGPMPADGINPYWMVDFGTADRAKLVEDRLSEAGIGSRRWWPAAMTESTPFLDHPTSGNRVANGLASSVLGLPMFRGISEEQVQRVEAVLADALSS
jgi:dTDP-4-amino-4,6-dideoxygalactose transaminase